MYCKFFMNTGVLVYLLNYRLWFLPVTRNTKKFLEGFEEIKVVNKVWYGSILSGELQTISPSYFYRTSLPFVNVTFQVR